MNTGIKIIVFTVLQIFMVIAFSTPADNPDPHVPYIENPQEYFSAENYHPTILLGEEVVIQNREAYATPLLYDASFQYMDGPLAIYVNGVKAHRLHRWDNHSYEDRIVEIAIAGNGLDAGFSGWIEERHLVPSGANTPELPTVTLEGDGAEDIALFLDYAEDTPIIATYPKGTQGELLGHLDEMYHIRIGDQEGFIKTSQVHLTREAEQGLQGAMTGEFPDVTALQKHGSDVTWAYEREIRPLYGSRARWPLWAKAEFSALCMRYNIGTGFINGAYIMPGPDDLPQQEAVDIAAQAVSDRFEIPLETLLQEYDQYISFFEAKRKHTGRYWWITFDDRSGVDRRFTEVYISSPSGEVVDF